MGWPVSEGKESLKNVRTKDLKVGMYVHDVGRSWLRHPWPTKSRLLTSRSQIAELLDYGITEVVVDLSRGVNRREVPTDVVRTGEASIKTRQAPDTLGPAEAPQPSDVKEVERRSGARAESKYDTATIDEEMPRANEAYYHALGVVRDFMGALRAGRNIEMEEVKSVVEDVIESVFRNRDAFLAQLKIRVYDEYEFVHPLNVAVLAISFGRHLGLSIAQLRELGLGAILHDVGKIHIPLEILYKPDRLTAAEFEIIKKHPMVGAKMLKEQNGLSPRALSVVLYHHERYDGSGYPKGISEHRVNPFIIISGLSDTFDALSSERIYNKGFQPFEALKVLFKTRDAQFPGTWIDRFVHCLGIYPIGTVVQLNTGETGVVVGLNHAQLLRPVIKLIQDSRGHVLHRQKVIDLNSESFLERGIKSVKDPKSVGVNLAQYVVPD